MLRLLKRFQEKIVLASAFSLLAIFLFAFLSLNVNLPFSRQSTDAGLSDILAQISDFSLSPIDISLEIDGIEGNSGPELELDSFNWGMNQNQTYGCGSAHTEHVGKTTIVDFHFMRKIDKASPQLFLHCVEGNHFPEANLIVRSQDNPEAEFLKVKFSDVLISSYSASGSSGGDVPEEQITLNFSKIIVEYKEFSPEGTPGASTITGWDLKKNKKI